ncbi:28S ribosomal protein S7, mitochondrial-like [Dendronephthya gigantea]|uniref:28S ribosomal protein S7, mitochondrial-like n=1 Tax=Dendronephthya gigantea TaxID=151771 RepID=UPI00106D874A|nr:28S ribosomal protein S7, mitochondrial-like [Dendronephthya gigantea]XP_028395587.1 28S ribosomal protein S7, mitochondrial-like [Dendronephthya gigantea]
MATFSACSSFRVTFLLSTRILRSNNIRCFSSNIDSTDDGEIPKAASSQMVPASIFHDDLVSKFVNSMMYDGKKSLSQRIMLKTFECIKKKQLALKLSDKKSDEVQTDPLAIFHTAMENAQPVVGVQPIKKAGKTYQVPTPLTPNRRRFLAIKWLLGAARDKPGPRHAKMYEKLCQEILDAFNDQGTVVQRKRELHKLAESNRAFANFRWW